MVFPGEEEDFRAPRTLKLFEDLFITEEERIETFGGQDFRAPRENVLVEDIKKQGLTILALVFLVAMLSGSSS